MHISGLAIYRCSLFNIGVQIFAQTTEMMQHGTRYIAGFLVWVGYVRVGLLDFSVWCQFCVSCVIIYPMRNVLPLKSQFLRFTPWLLVVTVLTAWYEMKKNNNTKYIIGVTTRRPQTVSRSNVCRIIWSCPALKTLPNRKLLRTHYTTRNNAKSQEKNVAGLSVPRSAVVRFPTTLLQYV